MLKQVKERSATCHAALQKELEEQRKATADKEASLQQRADEIAVLQEDIQVSHRAEETLADLSEKQRQAQDERIQKLIAERSAAREDCRKAEAAAIEAQRRYEEAEERSHEAEQQWDEVNRQLAQDPVTTLK